MKIEKKKINDDYVVFLGFYDITKLFIENGAVLNTVDIYGRTPLTCATQNRRFFQMKMIFLH